MTSFYFNELSTEAKQRAISDYRANIDYSTIETPLDNNIKKIAKKLKVNILQLTPKKFIFDYCGTKYKMETWTLKGNAMLEYIEKHFSPCNDVVFNNVLARFKKYVKDYERVSLDEFITTICDDYNELKNKYYDIVTTDDIIIKEFETSGALFTEDGELVKVQYIL